MLKIIILVIAIYTVGVLSKVPRPRGVQISKASLYDPSSGDFLCFDGSQTIPFDYVNDDYCDCTDGSDEPGTSACPTGFFHCTNAGHRPLNIVSSRVNDGICDCCDGSDEYSDIVQCANNCKELGRHERERLVKMKEQESLGYNKKLELRTEGKKLIDEKKQRLAELEKEQVDAENKRKELDDKKTEAEIPEKEAKDKHEKAWDETKEKQKDEKEVSKMHQAFTDLDSNADGKIELSEMATHKEFDIDSSGIVSDEEAKEYMESSDIADKEHFRTKMWPVIKDIFKPTFEPEKSDEETTTKTEPNIAIPPTVLPPVVDDGGDDDDDEDGYGEEDEQEDDGLPEYVSKPETGGGDEEEEEEKMPEYDEATQLLINAANDVRTEFTEAEEEVKRINRDITSINSFMSLDFGPDGDFVMLKDQCFEHTDREYTYKLCPFQSGTQRPKSGGTETTLGNFERWDGPPSDKYSIQKYDRGQQCWNGPPRSINVIFTCGREHKLLSASEPSRCEYQFDFETPCSCGEPTTTEEDKIHDEL